MKGRLDDEVLDVSHPFTYNAVPISATVASEIFERHDVAGSYATNKGHPDRIYRFIVKRPATSGDVAI